MAKKYFYRCIAPPQSGSMVGFVELGYLAPDPRKERQNALKPLVLHSIRVMASAGTDARGRARRPMYIATDKPVSKIYTEPVLRKVSRPDFDPLTGRRQGRKYVKKYSTPKLELLPPDEVDSYVRDNAIEMMWTEALFEDYNKNVDPKDGIPRVDLPQRAAMMDRATPVGEGDEPIDRVPEVGEPIGARGRV